MAKRVVITIACACLLMGGSGSAQESAPKRYWASSYGVTANSASVDRWVWTFRSPLRDSTTVSLYGAITLPERYSGRGPARFSLTAARDGLSVELFAGECTLSKEAVCNVSAWPVTFEPDDRLTVAFEFGRMPKLKWDESVYGILAVTPASSSAAASATATAKSTLERGRPTAGNPSPGVIAQETSSGFLGRWQRTSIHAYVPLDAQEGTEFKTPKKFELAEIELSESLGPGYVCLEAYPIVCSGAECTRLRKGKAIAKVEIERADGSVDERRIVQDRRVRLGGTSPSCPKHELIDFREGDRIRATVRLKKYPKTLQANSNGAESDSVWVHVRVNERLVTEPGKTKISGARLQYPNPIAIQGNPIFVSVDGLCNGLDRTVDAVVLSFRRGSDGRMRRFPIGHEVPPRCQGHNGLCAISSPNQCRNGIADMVSVEEGKGDGFIIQVLDRSSNPPTVIKKWVFEGPEYVHEWYCPLGPGNC